MQKKGPKGQFRVIGWIDDPTIIGDKPTAEEARQLAEDFVAKSPRTREAAVFDDQGKKVYDTATQ